MLLQVIEVFMVSSLTYIFTTFTGKDCWNKQNWNKLLSRLERAMLGETAETRELCMLAC